MMIIIEILFYLVNYIDQAKEFKFTTISKMNFNSLGYNFNNNLLQQLYVIYHLLDVFGDIVTLVLVIDN